MCRMRIFSRIMINIALIAVICCLTTSAGAEIKAQKIYSSDTNLQYAVGYQGVWLKENNNLLWYPESARAPEIVATVENIVHIAADNQDDMFYYLTEENGIQSLHLIRSDGLAYIDSIALPNGESISQMEAYNNALYALNREGRVCSVYPYDASFTPLSIDGWSNHGVTTISLYDNQLLTYKAENGELSLIDLEHGPTMMASVTVPSLLYVQIGGMDGEVPLAIAQIETDRGHELVSICMDNGESQLLSTNLPVDCAGLRRNKESIYMLGNNFFYLYAIPIGDLINVGQSSTITIVNILPSGSRLDIATSMFHQKYPDIEIEFREISDPRILATEMMAGTDGIDIIGIQDSWMTISTAMLLRSGAFLDLNQFEELAATKEYYRDIWGWVTISDCWFAVPEGPVCHPWQVNPELAGKLGWELPEGRWSWADFMELAKCVEAYNETADQPIVLLQDDSLLLPYFFHEYQANHVNAYDGVADYSSDAYIGLLEMWRSLNDRGLIGKATGIAFEMKPNTLLCSGRRTTLYAMKSDCYILPPTETETSLYPVYATGALALNANSQHLEEAVYFLTCYMSVEAESGRWVFNYGKWLKDDSVYPDYANDPFLHIELPSDENEELWDYMLEHSSPELYLYDIMRQQGNTLLPGLLDGTVTPKQFAQISQQLADMMLGE